MKLRFTSCQAPNADGMVSQIAEYLSKRLRISIQVVTGGNWQDREQALFSGEIQIGWVCGLPYVVEMQKPVPSLELLTAQVMSGVRYGGKPVYFSDVVVRADSGLNKFEDLRGKQWAYNEPHSHSGYNITRYMLAKKGINGEFFSKSIQAGSHERALRLLLRGKIDATALDSTVLETELSTNPELSRQTRVVESWGPSPIPPWVFHRSLDKKLVFELRNEMIQMSKDDEGKAILNHGRISGFVAVNDHDYDEIREMYKIGSTVLL